jgi:hypothetical protein
MSIILSICYYLLTWQFQNRVSPFSTTTIRLWYFVAVWITVNEIPHTKNLFWLSFNQTSTVRLLNEKRPLWCYWIVQLTEGELKVIWGWIALRVQGHSVHKCQ